jgi:hypothetical protein
MPIDPSMLDTITSTLRSWGKVQVLISKIDNGDIDQTVIQLNELSIEQREPDTDDYSSEATLELQGEGFQVLQDSVAALPYQSYDIPFEEIMDYHFDGDRLYLSTNRATYTITPL